MRRFLDRARAVRRNAEGIVAVAIHACVGAADAPATAFVVDIDIAVEVGTPATPADLALVPYTPKSWAFVYSAQGSGIPHAVVPSAAVIGGAYEEWGEEA